MEQIPAPYRGPVPTEREACKEERGKSPSCDSGDPPPLRCDAEAERSTEGEQGGSSQQNRKDETNKELLSFRGLMRGDEPHHGLSIAADHRRNGYVRRGDRGPWIRFESPKARALVAAAIYENTSVLPRQPDVQEVMDALKMAVLLAKKTHDMWLRVAALPAGGIELYVGDPEDNRIRVTPGRVELVDGATSETNFYETQATAPMVLPAEEGDLKLLHRYLNLEPIDRGLLIAWISYVLAHPKRHGTAFPILVLGGEHGAGKTFLCYIIQYLVDPSLVGVQSFPRTERDFAVTTQSSSAVFYDNLRSITRDASDMLCRAAYGGEFVIRKLYTDGDTVALRVHGAIVLNSIHTLTLIDQPDLTDRCLQLNLLPIDENNRRSERAMKQEFMRDLPVIFRGLLDLVANALVHMPTVEVIHPERMIDFVRWMAAMERSMGAPNEPYQSAYSESMRRGMRGSLEELPLASAVLDLVDGVHRSEWSGTPADLLKALSGHAGRRAANSRDWPLNASAMSKRLKPLVPALRRQSIDVRFGRGRERHITIMRTEGPDDE